MTTQGANHAAVDLARALLARFVAASAQRGGLSGKSAYGVSSDDVVGALAGATHAAAAPGDNQLGAADARVAAATSALDADLTARPEPLLGRLARVFSLTPTDLAIVALLLAPELEHELERVISFALDDFTRKRADVGFLARVIGVTDPALADETLRRFDDRAPLRRHDLVTLGAGAPETSATMRPIPPRRSDRQLPARPRLDRRARSRPREDRRSSGPTRGCRDEPRPRRADPPGPRSAERPAARAAGGTGGHRPGR